MGSLFIRIIPSLWIIAFWVLLESVKSLLGVAIKKDFERSFQISFMRKVEKSAQLKTLFSAPFQNSKWSFFETTRLLSVT